MNRLSRNYMFHLLFILTLFFGFIGYANAQTTNTPENKRNVVLVGTFDTLEQQVDSSVRRGLGAITAYKNLVFVAMPSKLVPSVGNYGGRWAIVDISNPANPIKVGETPGYLGMSSETSRAMHITWKNATGEVKSKPVLAVALTGPGITVTPPLLPTYAGLKLFDIADPSNPVEIGSFDMGPRTQLGTITSGSASFELIQVGNNKTLALLTPAGEEFYGLKKFGLGSIPGVSFPNGSALPDLPSNLYGCNHFCGDLLVVDISNPEQPSLLSEWGVLDEPLLGLNFFENEQRGSRADNILEYATLSQNGKTLFAVYSDYGTFLLDASDPANLKYTGHRIGYQLNDEGNGRWVTTIQGGNTLLRTNLIRFPAQMLVESNAFTGTRNAGIYHSPHFFFDINNNPLPMVNKQVDFIGEGSKGCSLSDFSTFTPGHIALMTATVSTGCSVNTKMLNARDKGAVAVMLYFERGVDDSDSPIATNISAAVDQPPPMGVGQNTGRCLAQLLSPTAWNLKPINCNNLNGEPVTVTLTPMFTGYGQIEAFDIKDPANPVLLSQFGTPNSQSVTAYLNNTPPLQPILKSFSAAKVATVGNTAYVSWLHDGLHIIDYSKPDSPREIGYWNGEGAPAGVPPTNIFDVVPHNGHILVGSLGYGLYILKEVPSN